MLAPVSLVKFYHDLVGLSVEIIALPSRLFPRPKAVSCAQFPSSFSRDTIVREDSDRSRIDLDVLGHTGIGGTLSLSDTTVATNTAGEVQLPSTSTGVHGDGLSDDEAIGDELANGLAGVGVGDLADLVGVQPDLALAAAEDIGREALLSSQVDPEM